MTAIEYKALQSPTTPSPPPRLPRVCKPAASVDASASAGRVTRLPLLTHRAAREMIPRPQRIAARRGFGPTALRAGVGVGMGADGHGGFGGWQVAGCGLWVVVKALPGNRLFQAISTMSAYTASSRSLSAKAVLSCWRSFSKSPGKFCGQGLADRTSCWRKPARPFQKPLAPYRLTAAFWACCNASIWLLSRTSPKTGG